MEKDVQVKDNGLGLALAFAAYVIVAIMVVLKECPESTGEDVGATAAAMETAAAAEQGRLQQSRKGSDEQEASEEKEAGAVQETEAEDTAVPESEQLGDKPETGQVQAAVDGMDAEEPANEAAAWGGKPYMSVDGETLPGYLQDYLYGRLCILGCPELYVVCLCQIYQESRYDLQAVSADGKDIGLCQFREAYFDGFAKDSGLYVWDIHNPIDQLYVYTYLMNRYYRQSCGDIGWALSMYYTGGEEYSEKYVDDVMQWEGTAEGGKA